VKTYASKEWPIGQVSCCANSRGKFATTIGEHKSWRELCQAALEANDPTELLEIVQELNKALKHEKQARRDFRGG
jgi:hypothetical protein